MPDQPLTDRHDTPIQDEPRLRLVGAPAPQSSRRPRGKPLPAEVVAIIDDVAPGVAKAEASLSPLPMLELAAEAWTNGTARPLLAAWTPTKAPEMAGLVLAIALLDRRVRSSESRIRKIGDRHDWQAADAALGLELAAAYEIDERNGSHPRLVTAWRWGDGRPVMLTVAYAPEPWMVCEIELVEVDAVRVVPELVDALSIGAKLRPRWSAVHTVASLVDCADDPERPVYGARFAPIALHFARQGRR